MSEVKRYGSAVFDSGLIEMACGDYVTYSDYQKLVAENAALRVAMDGVNSELYGKGLEVLGWHLNGDTEPLDSWFEDNEWDPETPVTDAAIAEIGAKAVEAEFSRTPDAEIKWDGTNLTVQNVRDGFSFGVTPVFVAANLRAGRKG